MTDTKSEAEIKKPEPRDVTVYTKGKVEKITRSEAVKRAKAAAKATDPGNLKKGQSER